MPRAVLSAVARLLLLFGSWRAVSNGESHMHWNVTNTKLFRLSVLLIALSSSAAGAVKKGNAAPESVGESTRNAPAVLWRSPTDIATRNLFYGPGGKEHEPHNPFIFLKEDLDGTNPKYVVRDQDGVKWKIKLGAEARPETVASRLVWAVGYFASEDYFLQGVRVSRMPAHLHRGQKLVAADGSMHDVRLKRYLDGEEKIGTWRWRRDPFTGTRELNGLRVMMALINNWDLKDVNNAVYEEKRGDGPTGPERIYMVSDLGASFGTAEDNLPHDKAKGNLDAYSQTKFVRKITASYVDFQTPARPALIFLFNPREFFSRLRLRWIGKRIPRSDARWMGQLLAQLSPGQIRDAFRSAGYTPEEVESFSIVVENRIAELSDL